MSTEAEMAAQIENNEEEVPADNYDGGDGGDGGDKELQVVSSNVKKDVEETNDDNDGESLLYNDETYKMEDDELFEGSTHYFAINYAKTKNFDGLLIAYFVIIMQFILYGVTAQDAFEGLGDAKFAIAVSVQFGKKCTEASNLVCPPEVPDYLYLCLAAALMTFFIMHDILACIRVFKTFTNGCCQCSNPAFWAALIILLEALFAALLGTLFALKATGGYDAIGNCVGVLFIHDADEAAYEAFMAINTRQAKNGKCKGKCCCCWGRVRVATTFVTLFFFVSFACVLASGFRSAQKAAIIEQYGEDFWDAKFSGGGYSWSWDTDYSFSYGSLPDTSTGGSGSGCDTQTGIGC